MSDEFSRPLWRRLVLNRFTVVLGSIAVAVIAWNLYVATHNHGRISGNVVDASGQPVAGATVVLWVQNFTTYVEKTRGVTDAEGRFLMRNRDSHNIQITAEKPGVGRSVRLPVRLYFRAEDFELRQPLTLRGGN